MSNEGSKKLYWGLLGLAAILIVLWFIPASRRTIGFWFGSQPVIWIWLSLIFDRVWWVLLATCLLFMFHEETYDTWPRRVCITLAWAFLMVSEFIGWNAAFATPVTEPFKPMVLFRIIVFIIYVIGGIFPVMWLLIKGDLVREDKKEVRNEEIHILLDLGVDVTGSSLWANSSPPACTACHVCTCRHPAARTSCSNRNTNNDAYR